VLPQARDIPPRLDRSAVQSKLSAWLLEVDDKRRGLIAVNAKKLATFAGIALVLFFVIAQPGQAAGLVTNIITFLRSAAESVISFVSSVFKG
jgi:hypothetical protein